MSTRKLLSIFAASLLVLGLASSASADEYRGWNGSVGGGALLYEGDEELEHTALYGLTVGYDFNQRWTLEGNVSYLPNIKRNKLPDRSDDAFRLSHDTWGLRFGTDLLYHLVANPASSFDPFVGLTAGAAYYGTRMSQGDRWDPYAGVAAGLTYWLTKGLGLRADYKHIVAGQDTEFNNLFMLSLTYSWGRRAKAVAMGSEEDNLSMGDANPNLKPIYFAFDSSSLSAQAKQVLKENADYLSANPGTKVVLEGHCDERGTDEYNLALGERRARSAFEYLRSLGVSKDRMSTVSYGESRPADAASNEAAWARNRRVECVELPK
ncbi:MAG TPA: peptidoglycan-associated lipoprotein Pal [Oligoflexia bacterium]|nr:peptidoglycan-associated lipoprotein Pal [Oligoflexia bacterium]HMP49702.1 peptidoglycan-associated lipoprotein Pal [Oligoflexia bacterium]